jgi:hypothetical protein
LAKAPLNDPTAVRFALAMTISVADMGFSLDQNSLRRQSRRRSPLDAELYTIAALAPLPVRYGADRAEQARRSLRSILPGLPTAALRCNKSVPRREKSLSCTYPSGRFPVELVRHVEFNVADHDQEVCESASL